MILANHYHRVRANNGYQETYHPHNPKILQKTVDFKAYSNKDSSVAVTLATGTEAFSQTSWSIINKFYSQRYVHLKEDAAGLERVPKNFVAFSMTTFDFKIGAHCHDFVLREKHAGVKGHMTYKRLTKTVQAAYFNHENGIQYLAGVTYYSVPSESKADYHCADRHMMVQEFVRAKHFTNVNRGLRKYYIDYKKYGRYCEAVGRRVVVYAGKPDGQICHVDFDPVTLRTTNNGCANCGKDFKNYKFETKKKKQVEKQGVVTEDGFDTLPEVTESKDDDFDKLEDAKEAKDAAPAK
uniref:Lipoprotein n=1 Tax=Caenorhabditis tropicalis TaxID=1561998 RepID=A0A1I7TBN9_9PELO